MQQSQKLKRSKRTSCGVREVMMCASGACKGAPWQVSLSASHIQVGINKQGPLCPMVHD